MVIVIKKKTNKCEKQFKVGLSMVYLMTEILLRDRSHSMKKLKKSILTSKLDV